MRISDWSSDVCSSDLPIGPQEQLALPRQGRPAEGVSAGPHAQCLARASRAGDQCLVLRRGARACDRIVFAAVVELSVIVEAFGVAQDRQSAVSGKGVSVRLDLGGRRNFKQKNN